jgi:AAA15 family ATPase/GTPase
VLHGARPGALVAIEEIDRGLHPRRYAPLLELLTEAACDGLGGCAPIQLIITTHSPSFLNKLEDRLAEIRLVSRDADGGTEVRSLEELVAARLGTQELSAAVGEIWEMGLLEETIAASV